MYYQLSNLIQGNFGKLYQTQQEAKQALDDILMRIEQAEAGLHNAHVENYKIHIGENDIPELAMHPHVEPGYEIVEVDEFEFEWDNDVIGFVAITEDKREDFIQFNHEGDDVSAWGFAFSLGEGKEGFDLDEDERERALADLQLRTQSNVLAKYFVDIYSNAERKAKFEEYCSIMINYGVTERDVFLIATDHTEIIYNGVDQYVLLKDALSDPDLRSKITYEEATYVLHAQNESFVSIPVVKLYTQNPDEVERLTELSRDHLPIYLVNDVYYIDSL